MLFRGVNDVGMLSTIPVLRCLGHRCRIFVTGDHRQTMASGELSASCILVHYVTSLRSQPTNAHHPSSILAGISPTPRVPVAFAANAAQPAPSPVIERHSRRGHACRRAGSSRHSQFRHPASISAVGVVVQLTRARPGNTSSGERLRSGNRALMRPAIHPGGPRRQQPRSREPSVLLRARPKAPRPCAKPAAHAPTIEIRQTLRPDDCVPGRPDAPMHPGTAAPALRRRFGESAHGLRALATAPSRGSRTLWPVRQNTRLTAPFRPAFMAPFG